MNRRNFTKNGLLAASGLVLAPGAMLHATPKEEEEAIVWGWLLRLAATAVISEVGKRAVGYIADKLIGEEKEEVRQVIHNNTLNYSSVHQYTNQASEPKGDDFLIASTPKVAASPGPVQFFGRSNSHRKHSAALRAPEFATMTKVAEGFRYQDSQEAARVRQVLLPRQVNTRYTSSGTMGMGRMTYRTQTAIIILRFELDNAATSGYYAHLEVDPYAPIHHTRDCRHKPRIIELPQLILM